jgi:hypothetical protein
MHVDMDTCVDGVRPYQARQVPCVLRSPTPQQALECAQAEQLRQKYHRLEQLAALVVLLT